MPHKDTRPLRMLLLQAVVYCLIILAGIFALVGFLFHMQTRAAEMQQEQSSAETLQEILDTLDSNAESVQSLTEHYNAMNQSVLLTLRELFTYGRFDHLMELSTAGRCNAMAELEQTCSAGQLFVVNRQGVVQLSALASDAGKTLPRLELMDEEAASQLLVCTAERQGTREQSGEEVVYYPVISQQNETDVYYYSTPILTLDGDESGYYLVMGSDPSILEREIEGLKDIGTLLGGVQVGGSGFAFAVDPQSGTFTYYSDGENDLSGQPYAEYGLQDLALADSYSGIQTINGIEYFCTSRSYQSPVYGECTVVVAALPESELTQSRGAVVGWAVIVFLVMAGLVLSYATILRNDFYVTDTQPDTCQLGRLFGRTIIFNRSIAVRIAPLVLVGVVAVFAASMYTQSLLALSRAAEQSSSRLIEIENLLDSNAKLSSAMTSYYDEQFAAKARLAATVLEEAPDAAYLVDKESDDVHPLYLRADGSRAPLTDEYGNQLYSAAHSQALQQLCDSSMIDAIYVYDENGRVLATNTEYWYFALSEDPEDQSYPFWEVLEGHTGLYVQPAQTSEIGEESQYVASVYHYYTCLNEEGETQYVSKREYEAQSEGAWQGNPITRHRAMVQICVLPQRMGLTQEMTSLSYVLSGLHVSNEGFSVAIDNDEEHTVLYSPYAASVGKTSAEIGISDSAFSGEYNGFQRVNGVRYFQSYGMVGDYYVATAIPVDSLYTARNGVALFTTLVCALFLILLALFCCTYTNVTDELYRLVTEQRRQRNENGQQTAAQIITLDMPSGQQKRVRSAASRWDGQQLPWSEKAPEQKLGMILRGCMVVLSAAIFVAVLRSSAGQGSSIVSYIISGGWDHGFHIFSLTACGMLLIVVGVATSLAKVFITALCNNLGARAETIGNLLQSVLKYGSTLVCLFFCLYLLGLDARSLLASAGILSLVIGLGAQSLIGDILAGMFIVFEGEFRVGDIVTIGTFRGQVLEIGLRTTKVEDVVKNIKIFNNSDIIEVLNMTKEASYAVCDVGVEYTESIERVERVLQKEFPHLRQILPTILDGPFYKGVVELGAGSVNIRVMAQCAEKDRVQLGRDLNREILILFKKHNINIPYPQLTLSQRSDEPEAKVSEREKREARAFVESQKAASKNRGGDEETEEEGESTST